MIKSLGPPTCTWFITLSANNLNWTDLLIILCQQADLPHTRGDINKLTRQEKMNPMMRDPISTARHFSHRALHMIHNVILHKSHPIGKVLNYFWRIEFQMRGSPHVHSLWWIDGAPNLDTEEGRNAAPDFIDRYITTKVPKTGELRDKVLKYQRHSHTKYGQKANCRFGFPQPLATSTTVKDEDLIKSP